MKRWLKRPEGSRWGEFGDDDQVGRMNLVTPELRRKALAEAREGECFLLGLPLDYPKGQIFPNRFPPKLAPTFDTEGVAVYDWVMDPEGIDIVNDDRVLMDLQYSTQWDGLAHYGARFDADDDGVAEHVFYNGYRSDRDFIQPAEGVAPRALALGIENLAKTCVQGRGVLVDIREAGEGPHKLVGYDALMRAIDSQLAAVETGDFLCIRTGYADMLLRDGENVQAETLATAPGLNGADRALLNWIDASGIVAICADNSMVEKVEGVDNCAGTARLPLHDHCLVKLGVHLGEFWWFGGIAPWLAERNRTRFLLTAPPLNLPGAVGSPATPIGTV